MLQVDGQVDKPHVFTWAELAALPAAAQVPDVAQLVPKRSGGAVRLSALLQLCGLRPTAKYLTLHATRDDFHASIPLAAILDSALLIYRMGEGTLPESQGGPLRFLIPDPAACGTEEIDECASVKYVDRLELTAEPGYDNRPADERAHARLHARQTGA